MTERADPIWEILETQGRSLVWLAQWIGYSVDHVKHVKGGDVAASPAFRAACVRALHIPEHVLFHQEAQVSGG